MKYRGIIFDFNGVLFWDADLQMQSWQVIAGELRGYDMTDEELSVHMHGRPNGYVMSYLAGRSVAGQELLELIQRKESLYRRLCLENPRTFVLSPGGQALLDELVKEGIPRTIATSSEKTNVDFFREHLKLDRWFDFPKVVYDDGLRPGKPAPDMYLAAARNLALTPDQCIVVEDAISGIRSAHAAGIGYIIGLGPVATHGTILAQDGVDLAIASLEQFPREMLLGPNRERVKSL